MSTLPERIGQYRILDRLGNGAWGEVFDAVHDHLGRRVALKILSRDEDSWHPNDAKRFLQEARTLAQLEHSGIVRIYDSGETSDGVPYLAMQRLDGETLRDWVLRQTEGAPLDEVLAIGKQIAEIMIYVHAQGFVHRDIKPENIMLVRDDSVPRGLRPILLDFGIVKVPPPMFDEQRLDTQLVTAGVTMPGTKAYMPPEQWLGETINDRADVYALGITLFELLAGRRPFLEADTYKLWKMHLQADPPRLHDFMPTIPEMLDRFIASMLSKSADERPSMLDCRDMFGRKFTPGTGACPFPGLLPFTEAQADLFFGRATESASIRSQFDELWTGKTLRWIHVDGLSGTGKSSLVHAAILPWVKTHDRNDKKWVVATMRPGEKPIESLAKALASAYQTNAPDVEEGLRSGSKPLARLLTTQQPNDTKLLLFIDQFEELFALAGSDAKAFVQLLADTLEEADAPLRLLTTIRSDYGHYIHQYEGLNRSLNSLAWRYSLGAMGEAGLFEVITEMARKEGLRLSDDLAKQMVRDAAGTNCQLPLLAHALHNMWPLRATGMLTLDHYVQIGGVGGALSQHVNKLLEDLGESGRECAKWLILDFVQIGRGIADTRRPRTRAQVLESAGNDELTIKVLAQLCGIGQTENATPLRLIVSPSDEPIAPEQRLELVHEMVMREVNVIARWIADERELLERHLALEEQAKSWVDAQRTTDGMPYGSLLDHYRGGKNQAHKERLARMATQSARDFLNVAAKLEQRRTWIRRGFIAALSVAFCVSAFFAVIAWQQRERARDGYKATLNTADNMVDGVDRPLARIPRTITNRRKILEPLHKHLEDLSKHDMNVVRIQLIDTKHRLSDLERLHGTLKESERYVNEAKTLIDEGLKIDNSNGELKEALGMNLSKSGKLWLAKGEGEKARNDFGASIEMLPPDTNDQQILATSHAEAGDVAMTLGDYHGAIKHYDEALEYRQKEAEKGDPYWKALAAETRMNGALATLKLGKHDEALKTLKEVFSAHSPIAKQNPYDLFQQSTLAKIRLGIAKAHEEKEDWDAAEDWYKQAWDTGNHLHDGAPEQKEYALLLCHAIRGVEGIQIRRRNNDLATNARNALRQLAKSTAASDPDDARLRRCLED